MDKQTIEDVAGNLAQRLADAVPPDAGQLRSDLESNFKGLLQAGLNKMDLVTREEFEVQRKVLERTRARLEELEAELRELEAAGKRSES